MQIAALEGFALQNFRICSGCALLKNSSPNCIEAALFSRAATLRSMFNSSILGIAAAKILFFLILPLLFYKKLLTI
jgi:hypothetical protein